MTAEPDLLTCPFCGEKMHEYEHSFMHPHPSPAHGFCLIAGFSFRRDQLDFWNRRTTATRDAEVEALRAEVEMLRDAFSDDDMTAGAHWFGRYVEQKRRAERLAEALRRYRNEVPLGHQPHMLAHEVDALLNPTTAQENDDA